MSPSSLSLAAAAAAVAAAADDDYDDDDNAKKNDKILECTAIDETDRLKLQIFQLGASYDRGYGASPRVRRDMLTIIQDLERCNPETNASLGIEGSTSSSSSSSSNSSTDDDDDDDENSSSSITSPLQGAWQMVWTTAIDVLLLQASPILAPGAIYQVFDPPLVTNIIDFLPRAQSLFPPDNNNNNNMAAAFLPSSINSLFRAKVKTRASKRKGFPNRIGLVFERVQFQPLQLLGQDVQVFIPPLMIDLPKLAFVPGSLSSSSSSGNDGGGGGPGYFDVTYLDNELLVIRQNEPGGLFVLRKVQSIEA